MKESLVEELLAAEGRCLRVFSQSFLPHISLGNLKHIRHLNLSNNHIQEIPCSICTMYNLQTLLLSGCRKLTRLPKDMGRLINLCHLETSDTSLVEMPPRMVNLIQLQTLPNFVLSENDQSSSIKELGGLQQLGGKLRISGLQNVSNVEDAKKANLKGMKNLSELDLEWEGDTRIEQYEKVLEALEPHANLKELEIKMYAGSNFPRWFRDSQFSNIVKMELSDNKYCCSLPPLGQSPSLKNLSITSFHGVETIDYEFYGIISFGAINPFPSLEELAFVDMPKWKKWSYIGNQKEGGYFPCLKRFCLTSCPKVTGSLPISHEIKHLSIFGCNTLMEAFPLNPYIPIIMQNDHWLQNDQSSSILFCFAIICHHHGFSFGFPENTQKLSKTKILNWQTC